jgi:hypothetical protein
MTAAAVTCRSQPVRASDWCTLKPAARSRSHWRLGPAPLGRPGSDSFHESPTGGHDPLPLFDQRSLTTVLERYPVRDDRALSPRSLPHCSRPDTSDLSGSVTGLTGTSDVACSPEGQGCPNVCWSRQRTGTHDPEETFTATTLSVRYLVKAAAALRARCIGNWPIAVANSIGNQRVRLAP